MLKRIWIVSFIGFIFYSSLLLAQTDAEELVQKGVTAFKAKRYKEAMRYFKGSYEIKRHPLRLQNIGRCYEMLQEYGQAIAYFIKYGLEIDKISEIKKANERMIQLTIRYDKSKETLLKRDIELFLSDVRQKGYADYLPIVYLVSAITYFKLEIWVEAKTYFEKSLRAPKIKNQAELSAIATEKLQVVNKRLAEVAEWKTLFTQGEQLVLAQKYPQALTLYQKGLTLNPPADIKNQLQQKIQAVEQLIRSGQKTKVTVTKETPGSYKSAEKKRKIIGWSLIGTGIVGIAASIVLFVYAKKAVDDVEKDYDVYTTLVKKYNEQGGGEPEQQKIADAYARYENNKNRTNYKIYAVVGSVLAAGAITSLSFGIYYLVKKPKSQTAWHNNNQISLSPFTNSRGQFDGAGLTYQFRF